MRNQCSLFVWVLATVALLGADTGAGSGEPQTPYRGKVDQAAVERMRSLTAKTREVHNVELANGQSVSGYNLALMYVRNLPSGEPFWNFVGQDETGRASSISLSDVSRISLVSTTGGILSAPYVVLEIEIFPTLGPKELLELKPTFSALKNSYQKEVRVRVPRRGSSKGEICLVSQNNGAAPYSVLAKLSDLKPNTAIEFDYGVLGKVLGKYRSEPAIWCATPSVIADEEYPYRIQMKK